MENTNKIYYYKLQSPYEEDETKDCKLSVTELDNNFKVFKDNIIKDVYFNSDDYSITINKYDDDKKIVVDLSLIKEKLNELIPNTSDDEESSDSEIKLNGYINDEGVLTLSLNDDNKIEIKGFLIEVKHDISLNGDGTDSNPLRLSELKKSSYRKPVLGIVNTLPEDNLSINDKYVTSGLSSNFGTLYSVKGMHAIEKKLNDSNRRWRITTQEDWNKLKEFVNDCSDIDVSGKILKSTSFWEGNDTLDSYGFSIFPTGFVNESKQLTNYDKSAYFLTSTKNENKRYVVEELLSDTDSINEIDSEKCNMYSIRLVCDCGNNGFMECDDIFGKAYKVIYIEKLGQLWLMENLNYNFNESTLSIAYNYNGENTISTLYTYNNWNGNIWEVEQLHNCDTFNVIENKYSSSEYKVVQDENGSYSLLKTSQTICSNGESIIKIDSGWY